MENEFLLREDAPISPGTWSLLDTTMIQAAKSYLSGRRILDIEGPFGFGLKGIPLTDCRGEDDTIASVVQPLHLVVKTFCLGKRDIAAFERDGLMLDTGAVASAALESAAAEDNIVFRGTGATCGLMTTEGVNSQRLSSWNSIGKAADDIIQAVTRLDEAGIHGPYALALSPARYNLLLRRYPQGGTELEHLHYMATSGIVKSPVLEGGGVLIASGKQYASIAIGQDMAVGFTGPAGENLEFTVSESLAPLIREPAAICVLEEK
ncbi:MAG: bacteriocin family protein [Methanoregulaceae archaeon]|nr:bacteriocin family protein [Methanoregulaceae archaeon]